MLPSIFNWLNDMVSNALDSFVTMFLGALDLSMESFINAFPLFEEVYYILQSIAVGMTVVIALIGLYQFFLTKSADKQAMQESPAIILIKAFAAAGLIYFGGYLLEVIVDISKLSFDTFNQLGTGADVSGLQLTGSFFSNIFSPDNLLNMASNPGAGLKLGGATVLSLVLMVTIAWEILKLVIEVAERYLIVAVLVYTSPLVYPTIASKRTDSIMKKWVSMFISSCILMSMSVIFLKVIVNGLSTMELSPGDASGYMLRLIMVLAMCKVAQRVDSYMQQLGLSAATTGGSLLDDVMAVTQSLRAVGRVAGDAAHGKGIAGKVFAMTPPGMAVGAVRSGLNAAAAGGTRSEIGKAAAVGSLKGMPAVGRVVGAAEGRFAGTDKAGILGKTGEEAKTIVRQEVAKAIRNPVEYNASETLHGSEMKNAIRENEKQDRELKEAQDIVDYQTATPPFEGSPVTEDIKGKVNGGQLFSDYEAQNNLNTFGAIEKGYSPLQLDEGAGLIPDYNFAAAGGQLIVDQGNEEMLIAKNPAAIGDAIRYGDGAKVRDDKYQEKALNNLKDEYEKGHYFAQARAEHYSSPENSGNSEDSFSAIQEERDNENSSYVSEMETFKGKVLAAKSGAERDSIAKEMQDLTSQHEARLADFAVRSERLDGMCRNEAESRYHQDIENVQRKAAEAKESMREIVMNTAKHNPTGSTEAFFGRAVSQSYSDDYGQAIIEGAFGRTIAKNGTSNFSNICVNSTPQGNELSFFDKSTNSTYVVVEKAGYLRRNSEERSKFREIKCADGITRFTTAIFTGAEKVYKSRKR